jgi:type IV pilus assembly protein PilW
MKYLSSKTGFTMIELLIAMTITSIVITGAVIVFNDLQSTATSIDQRTNATANARGSLFLIESEIRLAGFDPQQTLSGAATMNINTRANGGFFIFTHKDPTNLTAILTTSIGLSAAGDPDANGFANSGATSLLIGTPPLTGADNIADNIVAIRFAYAFDDDGDGAVDLSANGNIIWAYDTGTDGVLDQGLDTDDNGIIDISDTVGGVPITNVNISKIRAVKVWLLARTNYPTKDIVDNTTYVVGDQRYTPNDNFGHILLTTTIRCRNMFNKT